MHDGTVTEQLLLLVCFKKLTITRKHIEAHSTFNVSNAFLDIYEHGYFNWQNLNSVAYRCTVQKKEALCYMVFFNVSCHVNT